MCHYSQEDWATFAVGDAPSESREELQRHLDTGCEECAKAAAMWARVRALALREPGNQPPQSALHFARTLFRAFPRESVRQPLFRLARMLFDSRLQPALAGVRGGSDAPARFLFEGDNLVLDVLVERPANDRPVSVVGQITRPGAPTGACENLAVRVLREAGEVTGAETNRAGEFQMSVKAGEDLLLLVDLPDQSVLVSPLPVGPSEKT